MHKLQLEFQKGLEEIIQDAKLEGFKEGMACNIKKPSDAQFRKDHKTPVMYGEDYAYVVDCRSQKTAAKLLECDEDAVERIGIGWSVYNDDGNLTVGYYIGKNITPEWYTWGIWL